jgi:hypothetical protein
MRCPGWFVAVRTAVAQPEKSRDDERSSDIKTPVRQRCIAVGQKALYDLVEQGE